VRESNQNKQRNENRNNEKKKDLSAEKKIKIMIKKKKPRALMIARTHDCVGMYEKPEKTNNCNFHLKKKQESTLEVGWGETTFPRRNIQTE
jgi:hypothetical protein